MGAKMPSRRHEAELGVATPGDRKGKRQRLQRIRMTGLQGVLGPPHVWMDTACGCLWEQLFSVPNTALPSPVHCLAAG